MESNDAPPPAPQPTIPNCPTWTPPPQPTLPTAPPPPIHAAHFYWGGLTYKSEETSLPCLAPAGALTARRWGRGIGFRVMRTALICVKEVGQTGTIVRHTTQTGQKCCDDRSAFQRTVHKGYHFLCSEIITQIARRRISAPNAHRRSGRGFAPGGPWVWGPADTARRVSRVPVVTARRSLGRGALPNARGPLRPAWLRRF